MTPIIPMLPERHVWVFNGTNGQFPGGVFTSRELAEAWISARRLSGTLTAYPLDEGCFDWALRVGAVTGRASERGNEPAFVGGFSSAVQEHYHYEDGGSPAEVDERSPRCASASAANRNPRLTSSRGD